MTIITYITIKRRENTFQIIVDRWKKKCTSPLCFAAYHMPNQWFTFHFLVQNHNFYQYKTFSIYPHGCLTVKKRKKKESGRWHKEYNRPCCFFSFGLVLFRGFCEPNSGHYGVDLPGYIHPQVNSWVTVLTREMDIYELEFAWLLLLYVMMVSGQGVLMPDCTVQVNRHTGPKGAVGQPVQTWVGPDDNTWQRFAGPCSERAPLMSVIRSVGVYIAGKKKCWMAVETKQP